MPVLVDSTGFKPIEAENARSGRRHCFSIKAVDYAVANPRHGVRLSCARVEVTGFARARPILQLAAGGANRNPTGKSPQDVGQSFRKKIFLFLIPPNQF
jgi:hypothetical protein